MPETVRLGGDGPFVINLCASSTPLNPPPADFAGAPGVHVYRIRRVEDGRVRYRLRLGPFSGEAEAETVLARVRDEYPGALTATAGSEDLSVIATLQAKAGVPARAMPPAVAPRSASASAAAGAVVAVAKPTPVAVVAAPEPVRAPAAAATKPTAAPAPVDVPLVFPELTLLDPLQAPVATARDAEHTLASPAAGKAPVLDASFDALSSLLSLEAAPAEPPPVAIAAAVVAKPAPKPVVHQPKSPPIAVSTQRETELSLESTQTLRPLTRVEMENETALRWFVVELSVADHAFDPATVPNLDIFLLYRLYSVASVDNGRPRHSLRLGFFGEEMAARAVASYLRSYYEATTVQRVSVAERERFSEQGLDARKDVGGTGRHSVIELSGEPTAPTVQLARPVAPASTVRKGVPTAKKERPAGVFASLLKRRKS